MRTVLEMAQSAPGFKAYCRRRSAITPNDNLTMAEIFANACKAQASEMRSFCKRKGINSVLAREDKKSPHGEYAIGNGDWAQLKKVNGEFISVYEESVENKIIRLTAEQNRLLELLKQAA